MTRNSSTTQADETSATSLDVSPDESNSAEATQFENKFKEDKIDSKEIQFTDLSLVPNIQATIQKLGYENPSPIQTEIIPHMLEGRDVIGQAQTGTGKTAAFALPILCQIDMSKKSPQVLVLTPTRELAIQVAGSFEKYASKMKGFRVAAIYGGQDYEIQLRQIRRGIQVIVGTPGRTIDHIQRGTLNVSEIDCFVLDEADEMLNMGFIEDVQTILDRTPVHRQIALFSATMPAAIRAIAQNYLRDPVEVHIKAKTATVAAVRQRCLIVHGRDKQDALVRILESEETDGVIVFAKTRGSTLRIAEDLAHRGYSSAALNGDMAQNQRERTVGLLKKGRLDVLVATDIAARGLDVQRISHVINYDMPHDSEAYIHRIGRTGRAGREGEAILFAARSERGKLRMIERATSQPIEIMQLPSIDKINLLRVAKFKQKITNQIEISDNTFFKNLIQEYQLETGKNIEEIASALAQLAQGNESLLMKDRPAKSSEFDRRRERSKRDRSGPGQRQSSSKRPITAPESGMERFKLQVGHKHGVRPGNIVGAIANEAGVDSSSIGRIYIFDRHSTVDLPTGMPEDVLKKLQHAWVAGTKLMIVREDEQFPSHKDKDVQFPRKRQKPAKRNLPILA